MLECKSKQMNTNVNNSFLLELYDKLRLVLSVPILQIIEDSQKFSSQKTNSIDDLDLKKSRFILEHGFEIEDQHFVIVQNFLHFHDNSILIALSKKKESAILVKKWNENAGYLLFFLERQSLMQHKSSNSSFQFIIQQSLNKLIHFAQQLQ